jgi:uncharacterized protein YbjT (DUF2867 family)
MSIAVLGATGNIGRPLVEILAKEGHAVRAATRSAEKPLPAGAVRVHSSNLDELVKGAEKLFLLAPPVAGIDVEDDAIAAAKRAGVKHVVKLSTIGASGDTPRGLGKLHRQKEKQLEASGLPWTMLRPGFFMSNALAWVPQIRDTGKARNPYGEGLMYPIAPDDVAAVAAIVLTTPGHEGKAYALTGEVGLTAPQEIEILSHALGMHARVVDVPPDEAVAEARARGATDEVAEGLRDLYVNMRANRIAFKDDTARKTLGRPLVEFEPWIRKAVAR